MIKKLKDTKGIELVEKGRPSRYNFEDLQVGEAFIVDYSLPLARSLYGCIANYKKKVGNEKKKFSLNKTKAGKLIVTRKN